MPVGSPLPIDVQLACQDSLMRFMAHFDADEFDAMQELFAPDGTWVRADGTIRGLAELQAWISRRQPELNQRPILVMELVDRADTVAVEGGKTVPALSVARMKSFYDGTLFYRLAKEHA